MKSKPVNIRFEKWFHQVVVTVTWTICVNKRESRESKKELGDKLAFKENSWFLMTAGINHAAGQLKLHKRQKKKGCPSYCSRWVDFGSAVVNRISVNITWIMLNLFILLTKVYDQKSTKILIVDDLFICLWLYYIKGTIRQNTH